MACQLDTNANASWTPTCLLRDQRRGLRRQLPSRLRAAAPAPKAFGAVQHVPLRFPRGPATAPASPLVDLERIKKNCSQRGARIFGLGRGFAEGASPPMGL